MPQVWIHLPFTIWIIIAAVKACQDGSITADPDDCSSYIQCDHGKGLVRPCPAGLYFNPAISACDWKANVHCGGQGSTTTSTTTTTTISPTGEPITTKIPTTQTITTTSSKPIPQSSTLRPNPTPGDPKFAPYFDVNMEGPTLPQVAAKTNQKNFVLAFAIGSSEGCVPKWGGQLNIDDPSVIIPIRQLQAQGGQLIVATGGAMGPYFEQLCTTVDTLSAAYKKVLDTVNTNHLDIDVESTINADIVNQALAKVQRERPETTVTFTLMVQAEDYGLTPQLGVDILKNAKKNGVRVDYVNPMTMEFGGPSSDFGDSVINAAKSVLTQMKEIWPEKEIRI